MERAWSALAWLLVLALVVNVVAPILLDALPLLLTLGGFAVLYRLLFGRHLH